VNMEISENKRTGRETHRARLHPVPRTATGLTPAPWRRRSATVSGEILIIRGMQGGVSPATIRRPSHLLAIRIRSPAPLQDPRYAPYRLTRKAELPDAIIATKDRTTLMISVVRSRRQVPDDGRTLRELFPGRWTGPGTW